MKKTITAIIASLTIAAATLTAVTPALANDGMTKYTTTATDYLRLRAGAGTEYKEIAQLGYDTEILVQRFVGDWAAVYVPVYSA